MKKELLKEIIKQVVREVIKERMDEAGLTSEMDDKSTEKKEKPVIPPGKLTQLNPNLIKKDKGTYKLPPIKEGDDKWIQKAVDPAHKGYCTPMTKSTCTPARKALAKRFKKGDIEESESTNEVAPPGFGPGKQHAKVYNKLMQQYKGNPSAAYATMWKIHKGMKEGKIDEASYKVVSPTQARCSKCNHALTVQTEPTVTEDSKKIDVTFKKDKPVNIPIKKVNETAFKKQGPSLKTFKDSPQFPKAVDDPKNA